MSYQRAGYGRKLSIGRKAALLVIDCTVAFTGRQGLNLVQAQQEWPSSCGPAAWAALPIISRLLKLFREAELPIVFTRNDPVAMRAVAEATKAQNLQDFTEEGNSIPEIIAPSPNEWVLDKARASAFYGTPLTSFLIKHGVDSLFVTGVSTSGCVRASVVDAFSDGFAVFVVEDACFDRAETPHLVNLWDMHQKYANVIMSDEVPDLLSVAEQRATGVLSS